MNPTEPTEGSAPDADLDSAAWWQGLRDHRLTLQRCGACGRTRHPPMPRCPWCAATAFEVVESAGHGVIYSFVTAHVAVSPGYRGDLPYSVATVELDEGPRLLGRVDSARPLAIGDEVAARFADYSSWTELWFSTDERQ